MGPPDKFEKKSSGPCISLLMRKRKVVSQRSTRQGTWSVRPQLRQSNIECFTRKSHDDRLLRSRLTG